MAISQICFFLTALLVFLLCRSATAADAALMNDAAERTGTGMPREFVGGVYAMSNNVDENTIVVYARRANGTLVLLDSAQKTGGRGAILNPVSGVDPLISAFAVIITDDRRFVLAVNAGSNSVSVFRIRPDFSLLLVSVRRVPGVGPVSIAYSGRLIYVASADADGKFGNFSSKKGLLSGFHLSSSGRLNEIRGSRRTLSFRPSTIKLSPDGRSLVVSDPFAATNALSTGRLNEIVTFRVSRKGLLSSSPVAAVTSTKLNNAEGRNLPASIGFEVVKKGSVEYVVVPEARAVGPDGMSAEMQTSSVSIWRLNKFGLLFPVRLDVLIGSSFTIGQFVSCWNAFSANMRYFWVSNPGSSSISAFSFGAGRSKLVSEVAATGPFPIDLSSTDDGKFVYQLFAGSVGAFRVDGAGLTQIQNPMNVPEMNAQGIAAF